MQSDCVSMYMLGTDVLGFVFWPRRTGFLSIHSPATNLLMLAPIIPKGISGIYANNPICPFINAHGIEYRLS